MSVSSTVYRLVFKRTSTFALAVVVAAFFFERTFDQGSEKLFRYINRGKSYDEVKHTFVKSGSDD